MPKQSHEMSMVEYAKHRGCSKVAVSHKATAGKIPYRVEEIEGGKPRHWFDPVLCDAAWIETTSIRAMNTRPIPAPHIRQGRPRLEHAEALKVLRSVGKETRVEARKEVLTHSRNAKRKTASSTPQNAEEPNEYEQLTRRKNIASCEKLEAEAMRERIAVEKEARLLGYIDELEELYIANIADARDRFMYLTSMLKAKFPEISQDHLDFIDKWIMDIFVGLGKRPERDVLHVENKIKD